MMMKAKNVQRDKPSLENCVSEVLIMVIGHLDTAKDLAHLSQVSKKVRVPHFLRESRRSGSW